MSNFEIATILFLRADTGIVNGQFFFRNSRLVICFEENEVEFGEVASSSGNQKLEKRSKMLKKWQFGAKILAFFENRFSGVMTKNH